MCIEFRMGQAFQTLACSLQGSGVGERCSACTVLVDKSASTLKMPRELRMVVGIIKVLFVAFSKLSVAHAKTRHNIALTILDLAAEVLQWFHRHALGRERIWSTNKVERSIVINKDMLLIRVIAQQDVNWSSSLS
jgi:hypothetical protein